VEAQSFVAPFKRRIATVAVLLLTIALIAVACGGDEGEEESATPGLTGTAAPSGTAGPAAEVPGITPTEIILGLHTPLSGGLGAVYAQMVKAPEAYYRYVNEEKGGVCGRKIVLKVEDDVADPSRALEVTRKLVEQDGIFAMVGSPSTVHGAVWEYLNQQGVPDLLIMTGDHKFASDPQGHPWTTQMPPDYMVEGAFFGGYISENYPGQKVAVFYENTDFGHDGLAGVKDGLDLAKNELVSEQAYDVSAIEIRSQLVNMKEAGAEVVVLYSSIGFTAQFLKAAQRLDWHPQFIANYINGDDLLFQFVPADAAEGLISFSGFKRVDWTDDPAVAEHHRIMNQYGGPPPGTFTAIGQVLAELMVEILSRSCDDLTREGVMKAAASIDQWRSEMMVEGATITMTDTDRRAIEMGPMERVVVENGKARWEYFGPLWDFNEE
jgi:ABC-type branched-subunit amino acid transport system substrate-binding protein